MSTPPAALSLATRAWSRLRRQPPVLVSATFLAVVVIGCGLGSAWAGWHFADADLSAARRAPTWSQPFGTDMLGRSLLARCTLGGLISLAVGLSAAVFSLLLGVAWGSIAGVAGGRVDAVMMRVVDVLYGLPYLLVVILLKLGLDGVLRERLGFGAGATEIVVLLLAIGGVSWLTLARIVRGQVLALRAQPFIEAARAIGLSSAAIWRRHVLPHLLPTVLVYATLTVPQAMLQESFLSFLGIGIQPPLPSWGNLAAEGASAINSVESFWWLLLFPSGLLSATLLSLNLVGDALQASVDRRR